MSEADAIRHVLSFDGVAGAKPYGEMRREALAALDRLVAEGDSLVSTVAEQSWQVREFARMARVEQARAEAAEAEVVRLQNMVDAARDPDRWDEFLGLTALAPSATGGSDA